MDVPQEIKDLHRGLSVEAVQFLEFAERNRGMGRCFMFDKTGLPEWALQRPYPQQVWPTLLGREKLAAIQKGAIAISNLVKSIPERIFSLDAEKIARFYGIEPGLAELILGEPTGLRGAVTRGDFIDGPEGFKCVELNGQACIGGWELQIFAQRLLENPWMREFLEESGARVSFNDPIENLFAHVLDELLDSSFYPGGELNLIFLSKMEVHPFVKSMLNQKLITFLRSVHPSLQGNVLFGKGEELVLKDNGLYLGHVRIHAVIEYRDDRTPPAVFRAFKLGRINLYNGPVFMFLTDKRSLALLSEHEDSDIYDVEERRAIKAYVPWTRLVNSGTTSYLGETVALPKFLLANQENLVLKRSYSAEGRDVHIGWSCSPEEWKGVVKTALDSENLWIAQEGLSSLPYHYQASDRTPAPHDVVWGVFVFGETYGGTCLRMIERGRDSVINCSRGATEGLMYEVL